MRHIRIIMYIVLGLLAAGAVFLLFSFAYTGYQTYSAHTTMSRLEELREKEENLEKNFQQWEAIKGNYAGFKKTYLLNTSGFNQFRQQLISQFQRNGLDHSPLKTGVERIFPDVVKISVKTELTGTYQGLKRFVHEMESRPHMILFKRLKMGKDKKRPNVIGCELEMEVYFAQE